MSALSTTPTGPTPTMSHEDKRTAIYCRVSSPGQKENGSLEEQEANCRAYAAAQGWRVLSVRHEVYGGEEPYRPQLTELLDEIRERRYDVLLVDKVDRFSRAKLETTAYIKLTAQEYDCQVVILEAPDDSPMGQILQAVLATFASLELYKIRERTGKGKRRRVRDEGHLYASGQPKYGWRYADPGEGEKTRYVIDPEQAAVMTRIYTDLADKGLSLRQIAAALNAEGVLPPTAALLAEGYDTGKRRVAAGWSAAYLAQMVRHPAYWGEARSLHNELLTIPVRDAHGRRRPPIKRMRTRPAGAESVLGFDPAPYAPDVWPGIVSKDLAVRALAQIGHNRQARTRPPADPTTASFLHGGLLVCGYCGAPMLIMQHCGPNKAQPSVRYYRCSRQRAAALGTLPPDRPACPDDSGFGLRVDLTETAVWTEVVDAFLDPDRVVGAVRLVLEDERTRRDHCEREVARYDKQLRKTHSSMEALADTLMHTSDPDVRAMMQHRLEEQAAALRGIRAQRQEALDAAEQAAPVVAPLTALQDLVLRLHVLRHLSVEERRTVLRALGVRVVAWSREHAPWFVLTSRFPALEASWHAMPHPLWLDAGDYYSDEERLPVWEALGLDDTDEAGGERGGGRGRSYGCRCATG